MRRHARGGAGRGSTASAACLGAAGLLVLLLAVSCGYHRPGQLTPGRPVPTIHLAAFTNDTSRPGLQATVAAVIQRRLLLDARIPVVEEARADLILKGQVSGYAVDALAFDPTDIGRRFRLRITTNFIVSNRTENTIRFQGTFWGEAFYTAAETVQAVRAGEEEAVQRAVQDLAGQLTARLLEEW